MAEDTKTKKRTIRYLNHSSNSVRELDVNMTIADAELGKKERRVRVPWGQIAKYYEGDDHTSVLELNSGEKVYTTLAFNELINRLEKASIRNHSLDLRDVTGIDAHKYANEKCLNEIFNQEAENPKIEKDDMLIIMYGYTNDSCSKGCKRMVFLKSDIIKMSNDYNEEFLFLEKWSQYKTDWGMTTKYGPYINISGSELNKRLREASNYETRILDLSEVTQPNNSVNTDQKTKFSPEVKRMYTF